MTAPVQRFEDLVWDDLGAHDISAGAGVGEWCAAERFVGGACSASACANGLRLERGGLPNLTTAKRAAWDLLCELRAKAALPVSAAKPVAMTRDEALHLLDTVPAAEVRRGSLMLRVRNGRREYAFQASPWREVPSGGLAAMGTDGYEVVPDSDDIPIVDWLRTRSPAVLRSQPDPRDAELAKLRAVVERVVNVASLTSAESDSCADFAKAWEGKEPFARLADISQGSAEAMAWVYVRLIGALGEYAAKPGVVKS
jgi:hypothetical protein